MPMKNATRLLIVVTALMLSSCASVPPRAGSVEHIVLAWLKNHGNKAEQAKLIAAAKDLKAKIPEVQSLAVGRAIPSDRPVVDASFDVALVMRFKDKASMDSYEKNPVHQKAVKDILGPLTSKIVVHDFTNE